MWIGFFSFLFFSCSDSLITPLKGSIQINFDDMSSLSPYYNRAETTSGATGSFYYEITAEGDDYDNTQSGTIDITSEDLTDISLTVNFTEITLQSDIDLSMNLYYVTTDSSGEETKTLVAIGSNSVVVEDGNTAATLALSYIPVVTLASSDDESSLIMAVDGKQVITASITCSHLSECTVSWTSSDESIVNFSTTTYLVNEIDGSTTEGTATATVMGEALGTAIVTATVTDPENETSTTSESFTITVSNSASGTVTTTPTLTFADSDGNDVSSVSANSTDDLIITLSNITNSDEVTLTWYFNDTEITDTSVLTSDSMSVTTTMKSLLAGIGDAANSINIDKDNVFTVIAKTSDESLLGSATATITITSSEYSITSISLESSTELTEDQATTISADITPSYTTDDYTVTWSSDDETVATVTADDTDPLTADISYVSTGSATITVSVTDTTSGNSYTDSYTVQSPYTDEVVWDYNSSSGYTLTPMVYSSDSYTADTSNNFSTSYYGMYASSNGPYYAYVSGSSIYLYLGNGINISTGITSTSSNILLCEDKTNSQLLIGTVSDSITTLYGIDDYTSLTSSSSVSATTLASSISGEVTAMTAYGGTLYYSINDSSDIPVIYTCTVSTSNLGTASSGITISYDSDSTDLTSDTVNLEITDMRIAFGKLYVLLSDFGLSSETEMQTINSRGALLVANIDNLSDSYDFMSYGWNDGTSNIIMTGYTSYIYTASDDYSVSFLNPVKILAITPKKLIIADTGFIWDGDLTFTTKHRTVEFDLSTESLGSFTDDDTYNYGNDSSLYTASAYTSYSYTFSD